MTSANALSVRTDRLRRDDHLDVEFDEMTSYLILEKRTFEEKDILRRLTRNVLDNANENAKL